MWRGGPKTAPGMLTASHSLPVVIIVVVPILGIVGRGGADRVPTSARAATSTRASPRAASASTARALPADLRIIPIARFRERVEHGYEDEYAEHDAGDSPGRGGLRVERVEVVVVVAFAHHVEHALDVHGVDELRDGDGEGGADGVEERRLRLLRVVHEPPCEEHADSGYEQSEREHERGRDDVVEDGVDERRQRLSGRAGADEGEDGEGDDERHHHKCANGFEYPHNESLLSYPDILIRPAVVGRACGFKPPSAYFRSVRRAPQIEAGVGLARCGRAFPIHDWPGHYDSAGADGAYGSRCALRRARPRFRDLTSYVKRLNITKTPC